MLGNFSDKNYQTAVNTDCTVPANKILTGWPTMQEEHFNLPLIKKENSCRHIKNYFANIL